MLTFIEGQSRCNDYLINSWEPIGIVCAVLCVDNTGKLNQVFVIVNSMQLKAVDSIYLIDIRKNDSSSDHTEETWFLIIKTLLCFASQPG